jgi:predicted aspartyl protease
MPFFRIEGAGAGALALLTLLACARAAAAQAGGDTLSLTRGSRLMVGARINGQPVEALLDSAAEMTLVDRRFAQTLRLGAGESATGQGSGRASFDAALVGGITLEALGLSLAGQTVAVADLSDVGRRLLGRRIDVILGREIFDAARLSIDIAGRSIRVVPREREPAGVRLELATEHGVETLAVRVESSGPLRATLDLGNGSKVLVSADLAKRLRLLSDGRRVTLDPGGGLGGEATRQSISLRSLEVAGRTFHQVPATVDPQPSASDVNIGVAILRHFRITTDFANHAVWLESRD